MGNSPIPKITESHRSKEAIRGDSRSPTDRESTTCVGERGGGWGRGRVWRNLVGLSWKEGRTLSFLVPWSNLIIIGECSEERGLGLRTDVLPSHQSNQSKPAPLPTKKTFQAQASSIKMRKGKPTFKLVDEDDEDQQETIPHEEGNDPDLELAMKLSLETPQEKGEGEGDDADLERAIKLSLDPALLPQGRAPVGGVTIREPGSEQTPQTSMKDSRRRERPLYLAQDVIKTPSDSTTGPSSQPEDDTSEKVVHESSSTSDSERTESETETAAPQSDKGQDDVDSSTVTSGVSIPVSVPEKDHEALAGPDPEPMNEDQTGSDSGKLHVSLAGPNPEHMDDEFLATAYPKVHENLKLITDERVIDDKPESHSGSMSSMKNLDDSVNFGDQFLHDKPTEDDQEKPKAKEESGSTIPDPSHQTVTTTPPVIPPFAEISSSMPSLLITPPPINTEATTITTSLPEITPFIALQLRVAKLEQEMSEVKKTDLSADVLASIRSQVPTAVDTYLGTKLDDALLKVLERHTADLIKKYSVLPGPESVKNQESEKSPKEIIKAKKEQDEEKQDSTYSIRSNDKVDLEEFDLKSPSADQTRAVIKEEEDRISAASGSSTPPKDDDQSLKKPRESDASASKQHPALSSTGWQSTDTRDAGAGYSMHRSDPESEHSEQSSDDISKQDKGDGSDMEDTDNAHIPKVSTTTWFKPIPESERPATPEPEWTIPPNDFPEPEHNWANAYASTFKVPEENKLQRKTYDIGSFIKWFCRRTGKKKLCKADLEGPAFNLAKAFHKNSVFLQYQMDECHKLLTNKVDWSNPEGHQILRNIYEPLPLGGPPGQVTIQPQFFFNKDLDYLLTGDKERKIALSISKLKAARYLDFGLEELVPSLWVESEREYDISAVYGITHWWFRRISLLKYSRKTQPSAQDRQDQSSHSSQHVDEKPGDQESCGRLTAQDEKLPNKDQPGRPLHWDAADYYFKEDYTIVPKPRAVVYRDRNNQRKLMRLNELHKFSDGTLTRVMEKLDQMVKDFHLFEYNKGMETRKWSEDDKRRSKTHNSNREKNYNQKIYRCLESFDSITPPKRAKTNFRIPIAHFEGERSKIKNERGYRKDGDGDGNSQPHKGVKASANSDVTYSFTSAQDGNPLQESSRSQSKSSFNMNEEKGAGENLGGLPLKSILNKTTYPRHVTINANVKEVAGVKNDLGAGNISTTSESSGGMEKPIIDHTRTHGVY
ncbi:gag-pol polyprotein [Tanacetum coccineum]